MSTSFAIATADGVSVCDHLAHSAGAVIFNVENGIVVSKSLRSRSSGACGNHGSFFDMVAGCDAVICGGIGEGAAVALSAHGIRSLVLAAPQSVDDAAAAYLAGTLVTTDKRTCLCG